MTPKTKFQIEDTAANVVIGLLAVALLVIGGLA